MIAYAMPTHSVHSPIPVKGIPEPPLVIAWIARYFFALAQRKETLMGKVQILAVLTMDGCQSSELYCKAYKELRLDQRDKGKRPLSYHTRLFHLYARRMAEIRNRHLLSGGSHS